MPLTINESFKAREVATRLKSASDLGIRISCCRSSSLRPENHCNPNCISAWNATLHNLFSSICCKRDRYCKLDCNQLCFNGSFPNSAYTNLWRLWWGLQEFDARTVYTPAPIVAWQPCRPQLPRPRSSMTGWAGREHQTRWIAALGSKCASHGTVHT